MRRLMTLALAFGLLTGVGMAGPARADSVDDYLQAEMARRHIPGLSVAVMRDGKVVKTQGYGLANVELSVPAMAATIYPLASLSKQFTAVGIMRLVQDGKVGLEDGIGKHLAGLPKPWRGITVRELLTQTSGLPEWVPSFDRDPPLRAYTLAQRIKRASAKPPAFPPGTQFAYNNLNYTLLAGIIAKVTGKPYGEFLRETLFQPLGMDATGVYDPASVVQGRADGYNRAGGKHLRNVILYDPSFLAGAGGLQSTVGDLAKWDAALTGGRALPTAVLAQMWTPPVLPGGAKSDYGMGWQVQTVGGHKLIWHNGALPGAMSFLGRWPDDHLTVILLSNLCPLDGFDDDYPFLPLGEGVAALFVPALAPPSPAPPGKDPETTALLRQVLTDLAAGKTDPARFTPAMRAALTPAVIAQTNRNLAAAGAFQPSSLMLVSRAEENGLRVYTYRALYGQTPVVWTATLTAGGQIAGLAPEAEASYSERHKK